MKSVSTLIVGFAVVLCGLAIMGCTPAGDDSSKPADDKVITPFDANAPESPDGPVAPGETVDDADTPPSAG